MNPTDSAPPAPSRSRVPAVLAALLLLAVVAGTWFLANGGMARKAVSSLDQGRPMDSEGFVDKAVGVTTATGAGGEFNLSRMGSGGEERRRAGEANDALGADILMGIPVAKDAPDSDRGEGAGASGSTPKPVTTWKRSALVPNTARVMIGDREELPLRGVQTRVRIDGFRARVLIDAYFYNDRDRQYEGTFQLRLPNEASPWFFAFGETAFAAAAGAQDRPSFFSVAEAQAMGENPSEIMQARSSTWTSPREARMVPQDKAAFAYRETVRRQVDPALLEWSGAGVFSARVFPLGAKKLHRVVVGYDVDLQRAGEDLEYRLDLPSGVPQCIVDLQIADLPGVATTVTPQASPTSAGVWRFENPTDHTIVVRLAHPGAILLAGADPKTGPYFAARFRPDLPAGAASTGTGRAVFLVDISLSSNPERMNVWLKLLAALLEKNRDALHEFAVLFFDVESFWWKEEWSANTPENAAALAKFADGLALEGATDLGAALSAAAAPPWMPVTVKTAIGTWDVFLLSDGAHTWGESDRYALSARLRSGHAGALFAYTTGIAGTDARTLEHLARESSGAVFSVAGDAEVSQAAVAHRARPWRIDDCTLAGAADLLLAGRPQSLFPGQELTLVGRGAPAAGAVVELALERDGVKQVVPVKLDRIVTSDVAPRTYGQVAVAQLEDFAEATEKTARAYATHFRVTGTTCSLLMLETEADYARFDIKPEDDEATVMKTLASGAIEKALDEIGHVLGDAKVAFLSWLTRLENLPGVELKVQEDLRAALERMPRNSFTVAPAPLVCKQRDWDGVPGAIQEQLIARTLDYAALTAEAQRRLAAHGPADALKALSSLVENAPGDAVLARDVGFSALEWGLGGQAYHLFRRVAAARPFEPQTYRAMAQCLAEGNRADLALAYYELALAGRWDARFGEFRRILGVDYLRFLKRIAAGEAKTSVPDFAAARLPEVAKEFDLGAADLIVGITWNTDGTDVDLHVVEPSGDECFYQNNRTKNGGELTTDVTQGYGPEMYTMRHAPPGNYSIRVHYFADDRNRAGTRTKVYVTISEHAGTPQERVTRKVVTLETGKEMHEIATVKVGD